MGVRVKKKLTKAEKRYRALMQKRRMQKARKPKRAKVVYVDSPVYMIGFQDCRVIVDGVTVREGDAAHGSLIIGSPYEK